jgi:anaerobic selenocysteine-containing dehydrogenase
MSPKAVTQPQPSPKAAARFQRKTPATITRRGFLKTSAVVAGSAALAGSLGFALAGCSPTNDALQASLKAEEQVFRGVCRPNCFAFCHLNVHVRDGKVTKTTRAPYKDPRYSRICHRGLSHVQRIYDPERLKAPLRRVEGSARGAGEWEQISWDDALGEVADRIKALQAEHGEQAFAYLTMSGNRSFTITSMYSRLFGSLLHACAISPCLDMASYYGMMRMTGAATQLWECNEQTDIINAKALVAWGANITDAQVQSWHFVNEAKRNGTKLVVIDPIFTQLASKADLWIPVRPGSDTALYYGLMNIFLEKEAENVPFLQNSTVAPFLVRADTGKYLRRSDTGIEPSPTGKTDATTKKEVMYDPIMVSVEGVPTPVEEAKAPDLEATCTVEGLKCRSVYSLLLDEIAEFPPAKVSELTDVPVETLYQLAEICLDQPVTHYVGYGPQAYANGVHTTHAGMVMNALIGNLGYPGASYGSFWHAYFGSNSAFTNVKGANTTPAVAMVAWPDVMRTGKFQDKDFPIKMLYVYSANPLCCCSDTNMLLKDVWGNLEFVVVADSVMTDTARYADLVLPIAQWFEVEEATNAGQTITLNYNEKAIEPLYDSKPDTDIVRGLAEKLGFGDLFRFTDAEALAEIVASPMSEAYGVSYETLKKEKELRFSADNPHIAWAGGKGFTSPSGRLEFYLENPTPRAKSDKKITPELIDRERLPHFFPPREAWPDTEAMKKYPLHFMSERPRYRVHSQWFGTRALRELDPEPTVKINPLDAEKRGIKDGDLVECYNDRGHGVGKAVFSNGVRPGILVYPKGWQISQHRSGSWSALLSADFDPFGVNGDFMDTTCEIRVWNEGGVQ